MSLQPVSCNLKELSLNRYHSNLKIDYASGVSAITVYSISQFAIDQVILIGEFGNEGSEIIKTHGSTAPTGFTITLASATTKPHQKDCPVYIIPYDQIEFSHADTLTGAKTVLSTSNVDPEMDTMTYEDETNTAGYYFTRYKNSIGTTYSDYSDGIPFSGLPTNTVGYAIDTAMTELNASFSDKLTYSMCIGFAKQMLSLVRGKLKAWSKYTTIDANFGTLSQGVRRYALPSDVYDQNSNRSILVLHAGNRYPLDPIDRREYIEKTEDVSYTEIATLAVVGGTSLVLDDTSDLDDEGSIDVFVSGTKYTVEYTANTKATNTLTVAADQITYAFPVDSPVWQGIEEDEPTYFNVSNGYVYVWPIIDSTMEGENLTGDYYTDIETIDSDMDVIKGVKFDMLLPYLKYKIRAILDNNGLENLNDPSYQEFRELLNDSIKNDNSGEVNSFHPRRSAHRYLRDEDLRR